MVGTGKSGHIGHKIAATPASTGTTEVHPAEASHGDMGMITRDDVVANHRIPALPPVSKPTLLPLIKRLGITLISMTGNPVDHHLRGIADTTLMRASAKRPA